MWVRSVERTNRVAQTELGWDRGRSLRQLEFVGHTCHLWTCPSSKPPRMHPEGMGWEPGVKKAESQAVSRAQSCENGWRSH